MQSGMYLVLKKLELQVYPRLMKKDFMCNFSAHFSHLQSTSLVGDIGKVMLVLFLLELTQHGFYLIPLVSGD